MTPTFTVLIGSIGRPQLKHALESIQRQKRVSGDQVIVSFDAYEQSASDILDRMSLVKSFGDGFDTCAYDSGYHWLGVEQINHAMRTMPITGSHVFTIGDDDIFVDGAYATLREHCQIDALRPVIYKFIAPNRWVLWDRPRLKACLISGCCIAAPTPLVDLMHTRRETTHDYDWIVDILKRAKEQGRDPLWLDYVGVVARPEIRGHVVIHSPVWQCWNCKRWGHYEDKMTQAYCTCGVVFDLAGHRAKVVEPCGEGEVCLYA